MRIARQPYVTDLTDVEWEVLCPLVEVPQQGRGCKRTVNLREIVHALRYGNRTGVQWDLLPHDFLPSGTVYAYFRKWSRDGTLERINHVVRPAVRCQTGRAPDPTGAVRDRQRVKTTDVGGSAREYDAGKQVRGRKRHSVTDTLGVLLLVAVHGANVQDCAGARTVLPDLQAMCPILRQIWADGGYRGMLETGVAPHCSWALEMVQRPKGQQGFIMQAKRWVVERTLARLNRCRRLRKDYEYHPHDGLILNAL